MAWGGAGRILSLRHEGAKERTAPAQLSPHRSQEYVPPRSTVFGPLQSQGIGKSSPAPYLPLSAKAYQYFDPNRLPHFLIFTRVQNRTHDPVRAPETPCRLAYSAIFSRTPREQGGGAERAEGARHPVGKTQVRIWYGSVTYQRVKNQGRGRSRWFPHLPPGRETRLDGSLPGPKQGCTEVDAPL